MRAGMTIAAIEQSIDRVHGSRMKSKFFAHGTDLNAGAVLAATNAWEGAHCGITADQFAGAIESELIYVATLFINALSREHRNSL